MPVIKKEGDTGVSVGKLKMLQDAFENNKIRSQRRSIVGKSKNTKSRYTKIKYSSLQNTSPKKPKSTKVSARSNSHQINEEAPLSDIDRQRLLERALKRDKISEYYEKKAVQLPRRSIPNREEGTPSAEWFTDDDLKKMRSQDYSQMKKLHKE